MTPRLDRFRSALVSLGAGTLTFLVFFVVTVVLARVAETTEPHFVLAALVASAGAGLWAAFFMASLLALLRIDVADGARASRAVLFAALIGALLMALPPTVASTVLSRWHGAPPAPWSSVLGHLSTTFFTSLLALSPAALLVGLRALGQRRNALK